MIRLRVLPCLVIAACSTSPYAAAPAKASRPPTPAPPTLPALATPKKGDAPALAVVPKGLQYTYGAKFEPPDGRRFDGLGQFPKDNEGYLAMLGGDPRLQPATQLLYIPIGDWGARSWEGLFAGFRKQVLTVLKEGRTPNIDVSLHALDEQGVRHGIDRLIAAGRDADLDSRLHDLARFLAGLGRPIFLRPGGEFSGEWSQYQPYSYPKAFRRIHDIFKQDGADNVAFLWCYEPSAPDDFDVIEEQGARWFPGDDVVDWFSIDVFPEGDFDRDAARRAKKSTYGHTEHFLAMARAHKKPVHVSEVSANNVGITPDEADGKRDWNQWFVPFFNWLEAQPEIKGITYISTDWTQTPQYRDQGWLDARLDINPYIADNWLKEIRKPAWIHADEMSQCNEWAKYYDASKDYTQLELPQSPGR
jgi:hypothetical protein